MVNSPAPDAGRQRLALIQRLWHELQATRKNLAKYEAIAERIRREADVFLQTLEAASSAGAGGEGDTSKIPTDNAPYRTLTGAKVMREQRGVGAALKRNGS